MDAVEILMRAKLDTGDVISQVGNVKKALSGLVLPKGVTGELDKEFTRLMPLLKDFQKQLDKGFKTKADQTSLATLTEKIQSSLNTITTTVDKVNGKEIRLKTDTQSIAKMEKEVENLTTRLQSKIENIYKSGQSKDNIVGGLNQLQSALDATFKTGKFKFPSLREMLPDFNQALKTNNFVEFNHQLDQTKDKIMQLSQGNRIDLANTLVGADKVKGDIAAADQAITKFFSTLQVNKSSASSIEVLVNKLKELGSNIDTSKLESLARGAEAIGNASGSVQNLSNSFNQIQQSASGAASGLLTMQQQVDQLKYSTQYFFGLRNMINLFRRGVRQAIDSVKNLDKAMTATAVVTKFDVSDMWDKLPEYTANANKLGATVQDMYEATTLYYQQGLNTEQAMSIATETIKFSRIAGLEAAEATDMMTAALRGFNMELNEVSAQHINDVYSNLAAKSASNQKEIGTAMQRTASIANSAGMSFEGTSAFLAQAIETTREPAENLGTAMKTIIARFQELKENPIGLQEVEGEEVSFNKVDKALQSIGVDLKNTNGQFRELDQVFLDISQRWDSLTQTQQRYVATTAAGSRQQSRFIAMMSNYKRTTELMGFAKNSEGASGAQFKKYLESYEAKVAKLKNAWQEFTMNIANNKIIKGAVSGLTTLIGGINKLIDTLSLGSGPIKSFLSLMTAFVGLKVGGRIINGLVGGLGGMVDPSTGFATGMHQGIMNKGNPTLASQIYQPIVAELRALNGKVSSNQSNFLTAEQQRYKDFASANQRIKDLGGNFKLNDLTKVFHGLNRTDQNTLARNYSGSFSAAQRGAADFWTNTLGVSRKDIMAGISQLNTDRRTNPNSTTEGFLSRIRTPADLAKAIQSATGDNSNATAQRLLQFDQLIDKGATDRFNKILPNITEKALNAYDKQAATGRAMPVTREELVKTLSSDAYKQRAIQGIKAGTLAGVANPDVKLTGGEKFANAVGTAASAVSGFGMGLQSVASTLMRSTNPALVTFGTLLSNAGSLISGFGMLIGGLGNGFTAMSTTFQNTLHMGASAAGALTGGIFAAVTAIGIGVAAVQMYNKKIRENAEKVSKDYKEQSEEQKANIENLNSWKEDLARLSKGVDSNGNNVNLENSDYQRYLEIANGIAKINPLIVKGYNEQGDAIINNNKALEETLKLEKENQRKTLEEYTSDQSTQKLKKALKLERTAQVIQKDEFQAFTKGSQRFGKSTGLYEYEPQKEMRKQAQKAADILKEGVAANWLKTEDFADLNIDFDKLAAGQEEAVNNFNRHYMELSNRVTNAMEKAGEDVSESTKESFASTIGDYQDAFDEMEELITPAYEQLVAKMSQTESFKQIPEEMVTYYNQGLKEIVSNGNDLDWDANAAKLTTKMTDLIQDSDYTNAMKKIADAQEKFGDTLDEEEYKSVASEVNKQLQSLADGIENKGSGYGKALNEFLVNQMDQISKFTEGSAATVTESLNTLADRITAAEGTLENFNKVAEGSNYSTAATKMKEIYDTAMSKTHKEGKGDQTFHAGAEALIGRENIRELKGSGSIKNVLNKTIKPMLEEGQKGFDAFYYHWIAKKDKLDKIKGLELDANGFLKSINSKDNTQVYTEIADTLNISEELLTSMLNKGRQFADINFTDWEGVRQGLATSESTIAGAMGKDDRRKLFIKQEALEAELSNSGITGVKEQEAYIKKLRQKEGIYTIKEAQNIKSTDYFKQLGINGQDYQEQIKSLIKTFGDTGQFTKDEISKYAEKFSKLNGKKSLDAGWFDQMFKAYEQETDNPELEPLQSIDEAVQSIQSMMTSDRIEKGHLDNPQAERHEKNLFGGKGADTEAQLFAKGFNKEGQAINASEYEETSKNLTDFITQADNYIAELKEGRKEATGKEKDKYDDEIKRWENMLEYANKYLASGQEKFKQRQQKNEEKIEAINGGNDNNILKGFTAESIKTRADQETLNQLYKSYQSVLKGGESKTLTNDLITRMQNMGINIDKALKQGIVNDKKGVYEATKKGAKEGSEQGSKKGSEQGSKKGSEQGNKTSNQRTQDNQNQNQNNRNNQDQPQNEPKGTEQVKKGVNEIKNGITGAFKKITNTLKPNNGVADAKEGITGAFKGIKNFFKPFRQGEEKTGKNSNATLQVSAKTKGFKDAQEKITGIKKAVKKDAILRVKTTGVQRLKTAKNTISKIKDSASNVDSSVKITSEGDTSGINDIVKAAKKAKPMVKVGVSGVDTALAQVNRIAGLSSKTLNYSVNVTGKKKSFKVDVTPAFKGLNNKIVNSPLPSGSLAGGTGKGRIGPKGRGGLTLTGERGYEIAWLPRENRSMILGTEGPEMLNLPKDAVVWNHQQSQNIIKKKAIPSGSAYIGAGSAANPPKSQDTTVTVETPYVPNTKNPYNKNGKTTVTIKNGSKGSSKGKSGKEKDEILVYNNFKRMYKAWLIITKKSGKISTWWENISKRVEGAERLTNKNQEAFEKLLAKASTTFADITKVTNKYISSLNLQIKLNKIIYNKYDKQLKRIDKGGGRSTVYRNAVVASTNATGKWTTGKTKKGKKYQYKKGEGVLHELNRLRVQLAAAEETDSKKDDKAIKKAIRELKKSKRYRKAMRRVRKNIALQEVNWEEPGRVKYVSKKGSKVRTKYKTKNVKQSKVIDFSKIVYRDPATGEYLLNAKAINRMGKSKAERKAIKEKGQKLVDEKNKRRNDAEDKRRAAQKQLEELGQKLYENFHGWENELTKVFNLTQQLTQLEERRQLAIKKEEVGASFLKSGLAKASEDFLRNSLNLYKQQLKNDKEQTTKRVALLKAQRSEMDKLLSTEDETKRIDLLSRKLQGDKNIVKGQAKVNKAQKKVNKTQSKVNSYNKNRQKASNAYKDKKKQQQEIKKQQKILNNKKSSEAEKKAARKAIKEAKAKIKRDNKIIKLNSTRKLTAKNAKTVRKQRDKDQRDLATINKKLQNKNLSKEKRKKLLEQKKNLKTSIARENRFLNAYNAKTNNQKARKDLQAAKQSLKQIKARNKNLNNAQKAEVEAERKALIERRKNVKAAQRYIKVEQNKDGTYDVTIDSERLERDKDSGKISQELYNFIKEYNDKAVENSNNINETINAQLDLIKELSDTLGELREQYASRSEELLSALEDQTQKQIDKLGKLNSALSDALKDLLDEVKRRLDARRQKEDNSKTENDLAKKMQRLAVLQADTSGGKASEIKQLQQEIADSQQSYGRTLEDQLLQRLQEQGDEASKQREKMIQLLTAQLAYQKGSGVLAAQVDALLANPEANKARIRELWYSNKEYGALTAARKEVTDAEWEQYYADISSYGLPARITEIIKTLQDIRYDTDLLTGNYKSAIKSEDIKGIDIQNISGYGAKAIQEIANRAGVAQAEMAGVAVRNGITGTTASGNKVSATNGTINALGTKVAAAAGDKIYLQDWDAEKGEGTGSVSVYDINSIDPEKNESLIKNNIDEFREAFAYAMITQGLGSVVNSKAAALVQALGVVGKTYTTANGITGSVGKDGLFYYGSGVEGVRKWNLTTGKQSLEKFDKNSFKEKAETWAVGREYKEVNENRKKKNQSIKDPKKRYKTYKRGGLATQTGPAWLDGTRTKPELVLNAADTKNFIALKDILSNAVSGIDSINSGTTYGDSTYEININVDHLNNDYDVDRVAKRVEKIITQDAGYRNVTMVRKFR